MKKMRATALVVVLLLSISLLAGCGGGSGSKPTASPVATGDTMEEAISNYSLDVASDGWQDMSSDRLTEEELLAAYETVKAKPAYSMKYEDVVGIVGVEPSRARFNGEKRTFEWQTKENSARDISFIFEEKDGEWLYYMFSKTNM